MLNQIKKLFGIVPKAEVPAEVPYKVEAPTPTPAVEKVITAEESKNIIAEPARPAKKKPAAKKAPAAKKPRASKAV